MKRPTNSNDEKKMKRAVFLDRDGVINPLVWNPPFSSYDSPHRPEDMTLLPGVAKALIALAKAGYLLIVASNQPSAAKGKCSLSDIAVTHAKLEKLLKEAAGPVVKDFFYCYHHPESVEPKLKKNCRCRKPGSESLEVAAQKYGIDLRASWMVGDRDVDILCGQNAGTKTVLLDYPLSREFRTGSAKPDYQAVDLSGAAQIILNSLAREPDLV